MKLKIIFCLFSFISFSVILTAQEAELKFYDIIEEDSAMLYFNSANSFTEKPCANFIRYIRVDSMGNFNGCFVDKDLQGHLLCKGNYVHGEKNGYFEIFYPAAKLWAHGNFLNNLPRGKWEFFYENNLPERTLSISDTDTILTDFSDSKGNKKVVNGTGDFEGLVAGIDQMHQSQLTAWGSVLNGKPDGKWKSKMGKDIAYCNEEFLEGKLIKGSFPGALIGAGKEYHERSFLNSFFLNSHLLPLENFRTFKCADTVYYLPRFSFDINNFNSNLRERIDKVIENDFANGNTSEYQPGDNKLVLEFSIDKKGRPDEFRLMSGWGRRLADVIETAIRMQSFPAEPGKMYFYLTLHFPGGNTYQYQFNFSKNFF